MNPDRTVLIVGGLPETVRTAKELGLEVLLLQHPDKVTAEQESLADVLVAVDFTDWAATEPVVRRLHDEHGFAAAVSLTEPGLEPAARVNDHYGLGGTGHEATRRIRDKWAMRRHLARLDPEAVQARLLLHRGDLEAFGDEHGYPFIVKPTDATASIGVFKVDGPADAERIWQQVSALRGTRTDRISTMYVLQDFLMEQYVEGAEFSVESFSFAGRHVIVAITEKFTAEGHFAELGHAVPARVGEEVAERVRAAVARFLDHMGVTDGVCHTEVRAGEHAVRVIEGHTRWGGDAIPELVLAAYGVDLGRLAVGWPFRLVEELPDRPAPHAGASSRFLVGAHGRVTAVEGVEQARALPGVLAVKITAKPGDPVRPLRDNWDRLGLVAVTAADASAAIELAEQVTTTALRITVEDEYGRVSTARLAELGPSLVEAP
ncbi:ATP-grasp domain-containing protein [Amorphoplanes nipponensis]|uniref:Argininosuccinate lyase n=1 Tax=Actinoplanes nipponensis TaxID=135950 RepID=A0A919MH21_9ACTN|nr:ATP-grasp domain-containing protein [Actinoplanes nipponensis]GIE49204.1 argininosuccinate lyase [Actinoplanes nipponensis]